MPERALTAAWKLSEERHERDAMLLANVRDSVIVTDLDGIVTYWNEGATRTFGWTAAERVGLPLSDRFPEHVRAQAAERMQNILDGEDWIGEVYDYRKDGSRVWVGARVGRIAGPDGKPLGLIGVSYVIDSRKHAEASRDQALEQLRASEERFRQIAESISEVFWLASTDKHEIVYVSSAYETVWGRSREGLYANPREWFDAVHPDDRERVLHAEVTRQRVTGYDEEYRIVRPDGSIRWVRDRAFPVRDAAARVVRVAGVAEDITERRQLESQLRQAQKMEAIGQLAGGLAHDFNNLLTIMSGYSELLLDTLPAGDPSREFVDEILKAGDRSAALTRQLLAFSRKQLLAPAVIDLNTIVRETEKMLRRMIGEDIEWRAILQPHLGRVKADRGQFEQTLLNLVVNARDAMPQGGTLTIETSNAENDSVMLAVTDSGCGMSDDVQRHLFEPFFTTKPPGKGTGLGLAVVHGFVQQSGGHVEVSSAVGRGTSVRLSLPRTDAPAAAGAAGTADTLPSGTETILLVEDEEGVRRLARRVLQRCGYTVLEASRGDDALRIASAQEAPIHLLVADVVLPGGGGRPLAEQLCVANPGLKVLYVSGYTDDAVVRHGVLHEQVNFLQKPFTPATLARKVRQVLTNER